ncbi:hypothetical protein [Natronosalvus vescus]|uniref:hypothetical protein n=1 Tax=Natronosalvus vescus TaxID=2953881 RepID=UPI0020917FFA|nr:hypothetical protein [Natronosalvus vescus]
MSERNRNRDEYVERFWEQALKETGKTFQKQTDALQNKRSTLLSLIRYHFIVFGFAITLFTTGIVEEEPYAALFLSAVCIMSIFMVSLTIHIHNNTGIYYTGLKLREYEMIVESKDNYHNSLKELASEQMNMTDKNRKGMVKCNKYIYFNWLVLFLGIGVIVGLILP